jgi:HEPN domain-containing protein
VNHYTDVIAVEIHYAAEKTLKAVLAYENKKILKTHDLIEVSELVVQYLSFDDFELLLLDKISTYYIKGSYPTPDRKLPPREEIKEVLDFTAKLFERVCGILEIDESELV